jgi:TPR repeat protein
VRCLFCESCCKDFWQRSSDWERTHSNENELCAGESDEARALVAQASSLSDSDPAAALQLYKKAADAGSVWAMEMAGRYYDIGKGVPADFGHAQEYYYRALCAGSWMATIKYARLLERHGYHDYWPNVLEDGVRADFIPAFYWLAWFRYKHAKNAGERRAVRPLLEHAAAAGHPGAEVLLIRSLLLGRFGIRGVVEGIRRYPAHVAKSFREDSAWRGTESAAGPAAT